MNRREFATTVGAGLVFPVDLLASLAKQEVKPSKSAGKITIVCLGSDEYPATTEQFQECFEGMRIAKKWGSISYAAVWHALNLDAVIYEGVELEGLAFIFGSPNRPPTRDDFKDVADKLASIKAGGYIVTHHNAIPYRCENSGIWLGPYADVNNFSKTDTRWMMSVDRRIWNLDFQRKLKRMRPSKGFLSTKGRQHEAY